MAKIDSQKSRVTVFADDDSHEPVDPFYRAAPPSTSRTKMPQEISAERKGPRSPAELAEGAPGDDGFLRARRRVPVRRGLIPVTRTGRIVAGAGLVAAMALAALVAVGIRNFFRDDPRFRISSSASIQILGNTQVTRSELLSVFATDLGRNVFFIPLAQRRAALEKLPWVEHATVMRLLPDQLRVGIQERTPIAFVRQGSSIAMIDAHGVVLHVPPSAMASKHYSFPVVTGIAASDPLPVRAARMHLYQQFVSDLDAGGARVSSQLSEVDLSDAEDVSALLPAQGTDIQVHFGDSDFLARYRSYQQHLSEWRQQYPHLASVDMRYENQVVLDMTQQAAARSAQEDSVLPHHSLPENHALPGKHASSAKSTKSPKPTRARD